jgi:uncharacterized GH25 family protein
MHYQTALLTLLATMLTGGQAQAHFHLLIPERPAAKHGEKIVFTYAFGHPYEHEMFDTEPPATAVVLTPDGNTVALGKDLEKIAIAGRDGKNVTAFRFSYQPAERGDHVFLFTSAPVWMPEEKHFLEDRTKVVLHVETQNGWEREVAPNKPDPVEPGDQLSEVLPLTRPYGLSPGMAFRIEVTGLHVWQYPGRPRQAANIELPMLRALVEVERYNPAPPKELPPDEHITRTARTDATGTATVTLTSPGWWCVTAIKKTGRMQERGGEQYPVIQRATLWVHVDEPLRGKTGE